MNKREAVAMWRSEYLPSVQAEYETDGVPDYPARAESWGAFTDALCKGGEITDRQYHDWAAPPECERRKRR